MTSPKAPAAAKAAAPARPSDHPPTAATKPPAGGRAASTLRKQVLALANGKTQQEITSACKGFARTMSASSLPGTSEPTASKREPASSTPRSRRDCDAPRFDTPIKE